MTRLRYALIAVGLLLAAYPSYAADPPLQVPVAGKMVNLTLPDKTCQYNRKEKADAKLLDAMERADPRYQLLLAFMDCENLKAVRGVKGIVVQPGYYGQVLSNISGQTLADQYTREAYIQAIAGQYGTEAPEAVMARGEQTLRALLNSRIDTGLSQTIGVIKRDKDFIQIGMIGTQQMPGSGRMQSSDQAPVVQKIINVITLTKLGVPVSIKLGYPAGGSMTLQALSDQSELYVRQLISLNPESMLVLSKALDWWSMAVGAIGGMLITIIFGMLFKKR